MIVRDYQTGRPLPGEASVALAAASAAEGDTGAVPAYCEAGVWHYVEPSQVEHYRRNLGVGVHTVFVGTP